MSRKQTAVILMIVLLFFSVSHAQIPIPARIAGTVTVNGTLITDDTDDGYTVRVTKSDGSAFVPVAEDTNGLSGNFYLLDIPLYHAEQPGGANPGDTAVIHLLLNGTELTITAPSGGQITVGASDSRTVFNIEATGGSSSENHPPTASAGSDKTVTSGMSVTLDGSASSDPDGDALTFEWLQTSGTSVTLSSTTSVQTGFVAPEVNAETVLVFMLTVRDPSNEEASDTVSVTITVVAPENRPPVANAGPGQTVSEGDVVTLDGSNSTDPDNGAGNGIVSYSWEQISGPLVTLSALNISQPFFTAPDVGADGEALSFKLTVTDKEGATGTDTVTINVTSENQPPVAAAGPDQNVNQGVTVILEGSGSTDPDDGIAAWSWNQISGTSVSLTSATQAQASFTAPAPGEALVFELTVTDKGGLQSSDRVTVNVISAEKRPPVADAGPDQTVSEGTLVTLNGDNSSDPDNNIRYYIWSQLGGPPVTLSEAKISRPVFTAPDVGSGGATLTFELTVEDGDGLMSSDRVQIRVTYLGLPPVADAGSNQSVSPGDLVILDGSASSDPDGRIASQLWSQVWGTPVVALSDAKDIKPSFIAPETGTLGTSLTFELTVVDTEGLQDTDQMVVTISGTLKGPDANAGMDRTVDEGSTATLNGADSRGYDGDIIAWRWKQTAGPSVILSDPTDSKPAFFVPAVDNSNTTLVFQLTVTDSNGLSDTDEVRLAIYDFGDGPGDDGSTCFITAISGDGNIFSGFRQ